MEINIFPRWLLSRLRIPVDIERHTAVLFSTIVVLVISPLLIHVPHICLMRKLLGIPCPGCGVLHAMTALLRFDMLRAWHFNPAAIAFAGMLLFQVVARPVAIFSAKTRCFIDNVSRWGSSIAVLCLFAVWLSRIIH